MTPLASPGDPLHITTQFPLTPETLTGHFINGVWEQAAQDTARESINPANGEVLAHIGEATVTQVSDAVGAARDAHDERRWLNLLPDERAQILWRVADLIEAHGERLAQLESLDQGQPLPLATNVSVKGAAAHFRYYAGWCTKLDGRTPNVSKPDTLVYTKREPVGVCALIIPWNFPILIASWKLAPALAAGNTVVIKPAEDTSLTALALVELMHEAGIPHGVVNLVSGGGEVGRQLVEDSRVDKVSFTGSTEVGRLLVSASAGRFTRLTLELGGKAASIVDQSADLQQAIAANAASATLNSGQVCGALSRFYVHENVYDEFVEGLVARVSSLRLGAGNESHADIGPLATFDHRDHVKYHVDRAVSAGATILTGGSVPQHDELERGAFFTPTVLTDVTNDMACIQEEIFGPVLPVIKISSLEEGIALANDSDYGLASSLWSTDLASAHWAADRIRSGVVRINTVAGIDPATPWGGHKLSGWGREMGPEALDAYTETKAVWVNTARADSAQ